MNVLFVMCEGPHDAQFVGRLLQESGQYKVYDNKLRDWPDGIREFVVNRFRAVDIDSIRVNKPRPPVAPACAFIHGANDEMVLPVPFGGMDKHGVGIELLAEIEEAFADPEVAAVTASDVQRIAALFLYDADDRGIAATVDLFKHQDRYGSHFGDLSELRHGQWCAPKGYPLSVFVFSSPDQDKGTLEDYLTQLFSSKNEHLFTAAECLTNDHFPAKSENADELAHETKKKKATLTACGQQSKQNAGASLAVIVRDTELLNDAFSLDEPETDFVKLLDLIQTAFSEGASGGTP